MKRSTYISFILLPLFLYFQNSLHAQPVQKLVEEVMNERYPGGKNGFLQFVFLESKYPREARENCVMGVIYSDVIVDTSGQVVSVQLMNSLGAGIDEEVKRILYLSSNVWTPSENASQFVLSFGFELVNREEADQKGEIGGILTIRAFGDFNCKSRAELEEKLQKKLSRNRYRKAKKICEELMGRYPRNQEYKKIMENIEKSM